MVLEPCSDACGWVGAFVAMLGFGTFGVPIKSRAANSVDVDPLVMQTYKSAMCLVWAIILVLVPQSGVPATFTPWGILSGLFWVPGGVAVVYSIRNAGLALTVGISSSLIVLVSFAWGILIFGEQVKSRLRAALAVMMMIAGLAGMSYFSDPHRQPQLQLQSIDQNSTTTRRSLNRLSSSKSNSNTTDHATQYTDLSLRPMPVTGTETESSSFRDTNEEEATPLETSSALQATRIEQGENNHNSIDDADEDNNDFERDEANDSSDFPSSTDNRICHAYASVTGDKKIDHLEEIMVPVIGKAFTRRQLGIMCSAFNGLWGGSIMVPMHYSPPGTGGIGYTLSFAIGAMLVTLGLWLGRWIYNVHHHKGNLRFRAAYHELPSLHFRVLWWAGGWCGTFWSVANIGSMVSVQFLGEGMGYSICQTALLVSGKYTIRRTFMRSIEMSASRAMCQYSLKLAHPFVCFVFVLCVCFSSFVYFGHINNTRPVGYLLVP
jgi:glucose uptake protein GlcU